MITPANVDDRKPVPKMTKNLFAGQNLLPEIESIQDVSVLEAILEGIDAASTVSQLRQIYQSPTEPSL